MSGCMVCHAPLTVSESCFPGFDLLHCSRCDRSVKLIVKNAPRVPHRPARRGDRNRALRAVRRAQLRQMP